MAERHPRDLDVVRARLLKESKRPGFAAVARYLKPIGKGVSGPSIRFAETAIRILGNISVDQITVYDDREKRIVRVTVCDCEVNTPYSSDITVEKTVERRSVNQGDDVIRTRTNRKGDQLYIIAASEDDLLNKQNALISKAIRNNGMRLVPGDIVEECMDQIIRTQKTQDAEDPDSAKRKILDAFGELNIPVAEIKTFLGHEVDATTPQELMGLRQLYTALKDGDTTWREVMEMRKGQEPTPPTTGTAGLKESLSQKKRRATQQNLIDPEGAA